MSLSDKEIAYGKALMKYRRGMITHAEMMAQADKAEKQYREYLESQIPQNGHSRK